MEREIVLKVKGNSYQIEFPNVGKFKKIETMKQILSSGMYGQLLTTGTKTASEALDMIDMESHLSILAPKLIEDLKCKSFDDLDLIDFIELKNIYLEQFTPWWNEIMKILNPANEG